MSANTIDGVVITNTVRNDANIAIPLAAVHASYGTIEFTWQKTVDESDRLRLMQAAMSISRQMMKAMNGTLSDLAGFNPATATAQQSWSLAQSLRLAGVESQGDYAHFFVGGAETFGAASSLQAADNFPAVDPSNLSELLDAYGAPPRLVTEDGYALTPPAYYHDLQGRLRYAADTRNYTTTVSAYGSGGPVPLMQMQGTTVPGQALPGTYLHSDNGNYYQVSARQDSSGGQVLVPVPGPDDPYSRFTHPPTTSQLEDWERQVRSVNDDLGQASMTQMAVQQEVSGKLQSMTTLLTNLLQKMETLLAAVSGRVA